MSTENNVNGGTKRLAAGIVMTLGVGGALLFRQDPTESPRPESAGPKPAASDLLVRRSNGPPAASLDSFASPYAPQPAISSAPLASSLPQGSNGAAQFSGAIDPFRAAGATAPTQGRLTAEYTRPATPSGGPKAIGGLPVAPGSPLSAPNAATLNPAAPYTPSYLFVDPSSESERTPLNNVSPRMELPAEYPGARRAESSVPTSPSGPTSGTAVLPEVGMSPVGSSQPRSPSPTASLQSPFMNAGAVPNGSSPLAPRTVTPTLHAGAGTPAATAPVETPRSEPLRPRSSNARRHKVRDGDTLAALAEAYYGDAARYTAIYEANRAELSNPDVLTIGTYLVIPPADEAATSTAAAAANPPPAARLLPRVQIRPLGE